MTFIADQHQRPNAWKSIRAVLAGILTVVVLSLGTDAVLHALHFYPPWREGMHDPIQNAVALAYRCIYNIVGAVVTARLAPRKPTRHLLVFALLGLALGVAGAVITVPMHLGPAWYPVLLAVSALPCTWIGWRLTAKRKHSL